MGSVTIIMKEFIKKVIYFDIIFNLTDIFLSNTSFFQKGQVFRVNVDMWTLLFLIWWFFGGIIGILILKFLSSKVNRFIYESNKFVCYLAFITRGTDWIFGLIFGFLKKFEIIEMLVYIIYFVALILLIYYFWKYRKEISFSIFLTASIYAFTHLEIQLYSSYGVLKVNEFLRGLTLVPVLILVILILVFLRRKGVYDFRSREDKWLEKIGDGPYKRISKVDQEL